MRLNFPSAGVPFWVANPSASHPRSSSLSSVYFSKVVCTQFERGEEAAGLSVQDPVPTREKRSLGTPSLAEGSKLELVTFGASSNFWARLTRSGLAQ